MSSPVKQVNAYVLAALVRAVGPDGTVSVSGHQNRHGDDDERPDWTLEIEATVQGARVSLEMEGPRLGLVLQDAAEALAAVGLDVTEQAETDQPTS